MAKNKWIAAILNFVLLGLGTLYIGKRKVQGALMTIGAVALTYIENVEISSKAPSVFPLMFGAVFIIAIACAYDAYHEAQQ